MTEKEKHIIDRLGSHIHTKGVSNDFLVQLIELGFDYLNAETIPSYAKRHGLSYNGVKKCRPTKEIRGVKFVIDNE